MGDSDQKPGDQAAGRARPMLWQVVAICAAVAVLGAILYYGSELARETGFRDARAFRVLGEVGAQIQNLEDSRATLLASMPEIPDLPLCRSGETDSARAAPKPGHTAVTYREYVNHLDLSDAKFCTAPRPALPQVSGSAPAGPSKGTNAAPAAMAIADDVASTSCAGSATDMVAMSVSLQDKELILIHCQEGKIIVARESLDKATSQFVSQDFFDEVLLALPDGTVLGEFPLHDSAARDNVVHLHAAIADRINIINASALLRPPTATPEPKTADDSAAAVAPQRSKAARALDRGLGPLAFDSKVGDDSYHVYVLPSREPYRLRLADSIDDAAQGKPANYLYIVGLKRISLAEDVVHALWPSGLWIITLLISLNLVAWPLLSLAFGPAEESISPRKAVACVLGVLLVPAILTIAAASLWNTFELESWARVKAHAYLQSITNQLQAELLDGAAILASYRTTYRRFTQKCDTDLTPVLAATLTSCDSTDSRANAPLIGYRGDGGPRRACILQGAGDSCSTVRLGQQDTSVAGPRWSPFRTILAMDAGGERFGPVFSLFLNINVKPHLALADREYFQAVKRGQGWITQGASTASTPFVAQRLFNRGDASKALQLAVPLCDPSQSSDASDFCGVITGDMRMHSLITSISPPLLKYAVIDTNSGTVLFHSNDRRGLAENFFRESGENAALLAAIRSQHGHDFRGQYLGDPYHFFYLPVSSAPWGVVVFYSDKDLGDLPFRAGAAALVTYAGLFLTLLITLSCACWLVRLHRANAPGMRVLARRLWPRVPLPQWQRSIGSFRPWLWALGALLAATLFGWPPSLAAVICLLAMAVSAFSAVRLRPMRENELPWRTPARQYAESIVVVLTAVSVVPAYFLFSQFERLQLDALIRDGLIQSGYQLQARYDLIQQDLRRWIPPDGQEWTGHEPQFPDTWTLILHPDLGMSRTDRVIPVSTDLSITPLNRADASRPPVPRTLNPVERTVWLATVDSIDQQRRIALFDSPMPEADAATGIRCGTTTDGNSEKCIMRMPDGTPVALQTTAAERGLLIRQDFEWKWSRIMGILAALLGVGLGTSYVARLFTQRLIGLSASYFLHRHESDQEPCPYDAAAFAIVWRELEHAERLALYQIASGQLINPRNAVRGGTSPRGGSHTA